MKLAFMKAFALVVLVPVLSSCTRTQPTGQSPSGADTPKVSTATDPSWQELTSFLGVNREDPRLKEFVAKYQMSKNAKGPSGQFSTKGMAVAMLFDNNVIDRVLVSPRRPKDSKLKAYQGELPYGLTRQDTFDSVIKKFGDPSYQQDRAVLHYTKLKLGFGFLYGTISEITLDKE